MSWDNLITSTVIWWTLLICCYKSGLASFFCKLSCSLGMVLRGGQKPPTHSQNSMDVLYPLSFLQHNFTHIWYKQLLGGLLRVFFHFPVTEATWHASPAVFFSKPSSVCTQDPGKQFTQPHHTELLETDHEHSRLTKWLRGAARWPNFTRFSDFLGFL